MRLNRGRSGQSLPEYIIVLVLMAMALVGANRILGQTIKDKYLGAQAALDEETPPNPEDAARHRAGRSGGTAGGGGASGNAEENNPYEWDARAQRWYNTHTGYYVSFSEAGRYVDDPYMYYHSGLEPGRQ